MKRGLRCKSSFDVTLFQSQGVDFPPVLAGTLVFISAVLFL